MLISWFPLNGNFKDNGFGSFDLINRGASISFSSGKVTAQSAAFTNQGTNKSYLQLNTSVGDFIAEYIDHHSFSLACWTKLDGTNPGATDRFFSLTYDVSLSCEDWKPIIRLTNDDDDVVGSNTKTAKASIAINDGKWHHICGTYDADTNIISIYVDGIKYAQETAPLKEGQTSYQITTNRYNVLLLAANSNWLGNVNYYLYGNLNDARIYDHALSPTEIKKLAQGLACHFTFNFEDFYTPVDYLESTGAQRIKLNIIPTSKYKIEEVFSLTNTNVISTLWCARGTSTADRTTTAFFINTMGSIRCDYGSNSPNNKYTSSVVADHKYTLVMDSNEWYLNGTKQTAATATEETFTAGNKIELFASYYNGMDSNVSNYSQMKLYSFKIWDENRTLVGDFMPCIRNTDNKPGLYDWVGHQFYKNEEVNQDFKAPYYAPIEYIESDTTNHQYINTNWYNTSNNYRVEMTALLTGLGTYCLFGNKTGSIYNYIQYNPNEGAHYLRTGFGNTWLTCASDVFQTNTIYTIVSSRDSSGRITFDINEGKEIGTSLYTGETTGAATSANSLPMFLFATNYSSNADGSGAAANYFTPMRLYKCKIYDGGVLVRDFIPVQDMLTGEVGLYDNVENKFYTNAGSGSFSAPFRALTEMVDCSGYLVNGSGTNITESPDTAWGNSCAVFNGTDSTIETDYPATNFDSNTRITMAAWVKADNNSNTNKGLVGTGSDWKWAWYLSGENNVPSFVCWDSTGGHTNSLSGLIGDAGLGINWHHIAMTFDGTYVRGYIDGVLQKHMLTYNSSGSTCIKALNVRLGGGIYVWNVPNNYFPGKIADLRIYPEALSNADILALYQGRAELDNRLNLYGGNFIEEDRIYELTKENVIFAEEFNEEPGNFRWEDKDSYHELEYIESTGTQYINTGVIPTTDTKIDIDFTYLGSSYSAWSPIYGERGLNNSTYFNLFINTTSKQISPNYAGFDPDSSSTTYFTPGARYHVVTDKGQFYLNNELISSLSTSNTLVTSTVSMYLFALGTTSSVDNRGMHARIHSCRFYEGDTLIRNFVPVRWDRTGEIGLYDTIEKKFYTNDGTGDFIAGENRYQRLEYIQSTGTQYIDTGVRYTDNQTLDYELKLKCLANTAQTGSGHHRATIGMNASGNLSVGGQTSTISAREPHTCKIKWSSGIATGTLTRTSFIDGEQIGSTNSSHFDYNPYFIFACCSWTSEGATGSGRPPYTYDSVYVYGCKFWKDNILVRDFIPVKNSETDEVGLFDKVESTFYTNQGTGSFIAGPAVNNLEINKGRWVVGQLIEE